MTNSAAIAGEAAPRFKTTHDKSKLTPAELQNIYVSYEQYGEKHLSNFIQAIWEEAFHMGYEEGQRGGH